MPRLSPAAAAAAALALSAVGCGPPASDANPPARELRLALPADLRGFDPARSNDVPTTKVLGAVFESLLQYDYLARPLRVIPDLAAAMPAVRADGLEYTFTLRGDAEYHPDPCFGGAPREVRAEDFVLAFKRVADPKTASGGWWVLDGWVEGLDEWRAAGADYDRPVAGLAAPDPRTFRVTLTRPYPQFLYMMTMVFAAPVPREAHEKYGAALVDHPVGTGPFRVADYRPGHRVTLEKNPRYREVRFPSPPPGAGPPSPDAGERLPLVDRIRYEVLVEPQPAWLKFLSGKLAISPVPKDNFAAAVPRGEAVSAALAAKGIRLQRRRSQTLWYLGMNLKDPAFAGERGRHLRRAIAHAHDPNRFVDLIFSGRGEPHAGILPPDLPGYDATAAAAAPGFDRAAARAALAAAGYPAGAGAPRLTLDVRDQGSHSRQMGEYLRRELAAIGLETELVSGTYQRYEARARRGQFQLFVGRWVGDYPDAENWTQLLYGPNAAPGTNYAGFSDPEYDRLHEETRVMTDSPERRRKLSRMQAIAAAAVPWRVSFVETKYVLYHSRVRNLHATDEIYNFHKYLGLDPAP